MESMQNEKFYFLHKNYNSRSEFFIVSNMYQNDQVSELLLHVDTAQSYLHDADVSPEIFFPQTN